MSRRQFLRDRNARLGPRSARTRVVEIPANPPRSNKRIGITRRVPNLHGSEMGSIRIRIAYVLNEAEVCRRRRGA